MTISWYLAKSIRFYIGFPRLVENLEIIVGQGGNLTLTSGIKLGRGKYICKRIIICINIKLSTIQIFVEPIRDCPFEC